MKKKVLINENFKDRYTGKMRVAGKKVEMTEDRIKEIKEVNPNFITVIGNVAAATEDEVEVAEIAEEITEENVEDVVVEEDSTEDVE